MTILTSLPLPVVFPVHPRTRKAMSDAALESLLEGSRVRAVAPLTYRETIGLSAMARRVFTDSGGLQKEAFYLGVPCTTLRRETEWSETVELGWNVLVGTDLQKAMATIDLPAPPPPRESPYGDGTAGDRVWRRDRGVAVRAIAGRAAHPQPGPTGPVPIPPNTAR